MDLPDSLDLLDLLNERRLRAGPCLAPGALTTTGDAAPEIGEAAICLRETHSTLYEVHAKPHCACQGDNSGENVTA